MDTSGGLSASVDRPRDDLVPGDDGMGWVR
jgi:hypothetical protein